MKNNTSIKETLVDYDGPFLFITENNYLVIKMKSYQYICIQVNDDQLKPVKSGSNSVDDLFLESKEWYLGYFEHDNGYIESEVLSDEIVSILTKYFDRTFFL